jgi:transposase
MSDTLALLEQWHVDLSTVRRNVYRAATPRERERWHAVWLSAQGWSACDIAAALERDPHTIGAWLESFRQEGPEGITFEQTGGSPPPLSRQNKRR